MTRSALTSAGDARPVFHRGRLTVFVAAAPGAGKTFAMLEEGHRLKAEGKDVVIGLVEAYDRPRTVDLMKGLEEIPRKMVPYKQLELPEMDLDALLTRRPEFALVDELYHTNAPGVKNTWRYEDIDDLRAAGISVLTTMNIQHLESLKDIAEQIAGVRIRETIPDRFLEDADEVQLVDISPEALRKRMKHGNIYPTQNVDRALEGFFRPGNLAALRELALRWLASTEAGRVGDTSGMPAENTLVAIREPSQAQALIRRALRVSKRYRGRLTVVTVLKPGEPMSEEMEEAQEVAEALGADFHVLTDPEPGKALIGAARSHRVTQLVIGTPGGRFLERYRGTLVDELLDELKDVDLHVISRLEAADKAERKPVAGNEQPEEQSTPTPSSDPIGTEGGERGYLRLYVGYAPGCGTTATMLREGQRRAGRGTRVVVGAVATHGSTANQQALEGLEVTPPRAAPERPNGAADMDLNAVMASGAQVVCVDDLGYVNKLPDARFRYRYEEVGELRRAGFKVVSTVHLHDVVSVAPMVGAETGQDRRGVVPDWVLEQATELEVVDVPPGALLERLDQLEAHMSAERRARLRGVYTHEVLSSLREMALRLVASHTDARLMAYMDDRGITLPWESMERVMACVGPHPGLEPLIERAANEARRAEGKFLVVSVTHEDGRPGEPDRDAIVRRYLELTQVLGGHFVSLRSNRPAQAILDYAVAHHVTHVLLARGGRDGRDAPTASSIKRDIIKGAVHMDVHVLRELSPAPAAT